MVFGGRRTTIVVKRPEVVTIKITRETHDLIGKLIAHVSREGWRSLGYASTEPPTFASIVEAAVACLARTAAAPQPTPLRGKRAI